MKKWCKKKNKKKIFDEIKQQNTIKEYKVEKNKIKYVIKK